MNNGIELELAGKLVAGIALINEQAEKVRVEQQKLVTVSTAVVQDAIRTLRLVGRLDMEDILQEAEEFLPNMRQEVGACKRNCNACQIEGASHCGVGAFREAA